MKKLAIIGVLAMSFSVNAQWKKVENNKEVDIDDVAYYVSENDTIAKKWKDLYTGDNTVFAVDNDNYLRVWKVGKYNYLSFFPQDILTSLQTKTEYKTVVLFDDNTRFEKKGYAFFNNGEMELILDLNIKEIDFLKTKKVKGIMIENDVIDSNVFGLNAQFLQKTANIVWPSVPNKRQNNH